MNTISVCCLTVPVSLENMINAVIIESVSLMLSVRATN